MTDFTNVPEESLFQATLRGAIDSTQTAGIVISEQIQSFQGVNVITFLNPVQGAEFISCTGQSGSGELTGVVRGLPKYDGGPSTATTHPSGTRVVLSNPFQVYKDIATAVNSKADKAAPTIDEPTFTDWVKLPSYADAAARDVAITVPQKDMAVILDDDGDGKRAFTLYNGADWQQVAAPLRDAEFSGYVKFPVYADDTARDAAILTPVQSMVIYNINAATLQLYDGANWVDLDIGTPVPLATTTTPGRVRLATDQQVMDGIDDVGGDPLVVQPSQVPVGAIQATLEEDLATGEIVGLSQYISQSSPFVSKARFIERSLGIAASGGIKQVIELGADRLFLVYNDSNVVKATVIQIDYDTNTSVIGSEVIVSGAIPTPYMYDAALMSTDKVAITYVLSATNTVVRCRIADVSGTTITLGSEQTVMTAGSVFNANDMIKTIAIANDKAVVLVVPDTASGTRVVAFTVSGTTITAGTPESVGGNLISSRTMLVFLNTDKFLLIRGDTGIGYYQVGTISGTTITLGSEATWTTGGAGYVSCVFIETDKILTTYKASGPGSNGANTAKIITFSGTVIDVEGTPLSVPASSNGYGLFLRGTGIVWGVGAAGTEQFTITGTSIASERLSRSLSLINYDQNGDGSSGPSNTSTILANRVVYVYAGNNGLQWRREGNTNNMIGVLVSGGARGDTRPVRLYCPLLQSNQSFKAGEYYHYGFSSVGAGVLSMGYAALATNTQAISTAGRNGEILAITADAFIKL